MRVSAVKALTMGGMVAARSCMCWGLRGPGLAADTSTEQGGLNKDGFSPGNRLGKSHTNTNYCHEPLANQGSGTRRGGGEGGGMGDRTIPRESE